MLLLILFSLLSVVPGVQCGGIMVLDLVIIRLNVWLLLAMCNICNTCLEKAVTALGRVVSVYPVCGGFELDKITRVPSIKGLRY